VIVARRIAERVAPAAQARARAAGLAACADFLSEPVSEWLMLQRHLCSASPRYPYQTAQYRACAAISSGRYKGAGSISHRRRAQKGEKNFEWIQDFRGGRSLETCKTVVVL
jgi:hypothetical protein